MTIVGFRRLFRLDGVIDLDVQNAHFHRAWLRHDHMSHHMHGQINVVVTGDRDVAGCDGFIWRSLGQGHIDLDLLRVPRR
jgi:hypothetical protein